MPTSTPEPPFEDCLSKAHQYSTAGAKTVSLTVKVGGQTLPTVTKTNFLTVQSSGQCPGGSCSYTLSPTSKTFGPGGGSDTVQVDASEEDCEWTAVSNFFWIDITSGSPGWEMQLTAYRFSTRQKQFITESDRRFVIPQGASAQPP